MNIISIPKQYERATISHGQGEDRVIFKDFILQSVNESWGKQLKFDSGYEQWWVKYIGDKPISRSISGYIPLEYLDIFYEKYKSNWRVTKSLADNKKVTIKYKDRTLSGYVVGLDIVEKSNMLPEFTISYVAETEVISRTTVLSDDFIQDKVTFDRNMNIDDNNLKATICNNEDIDSENYINFDEFILLAINKRYGEKYSISSTSRDKFNINSFGASPAQYALLIAISENDVDGKTSAADFINNVKDKWQQGILQRQIITVKYRNRIAVGIMTEVGNVNSVDNMQTISIGMIVQQDMGWVQ